MSKDYAKNFYNSKKWRKTQRLYMQTQNYICERCGSLAGIVHHITYITPQNIDNPNITLSFKNSEAVCIPCHTLEHKSGEVCSNEVRFTSSGDLIKPPIKKINS